MEIKNLPALDLEAGLAVGSNSDAVTSVGGVIIGIITGIIAGLAAENSLEG
ncbi:MAG TPA: hypothetical protein VEZ20_09325 [Allosphingosinicella sp.]|jgi:hypothetical protein|nr:hypothetical protein [Allosphingosinicella sp.]